MNLSNETSINKSIELKWFNSIIVLLTFTIILIDFALITIQFNYLVELCLALLILMNFKVIMKIKFTIIDIRLFSILFGFGILLLIYKIAIISVSFSELKYLIISLVVLIVFSHISIHEKTFDLISILTLGTAIIIIIENFSTNALGSYFYVEKNSFSPLLLISTVWIMAKKRNSSNLYKGIFVVLSLVSLAIIQSRLNLISLIVLIIVTLLFTFYKKRGYKKLILLSISLPIFIWASILVVSSDLFHTVVLREDHLLYVEGNSFLDKVLSGRLTSFFINIETYLESPIWGTNFSLDVIEQDNNSSVGIHSIWLRYLVYGGLVFTIPFVMYIYNLYRKIKLEGNSTKLINYLLVIGIINSLGEPFAPFGTVTSYMFYWILLGHALRGKRNDYEKII